MRALLVGFLLCLAAGCASAVSTANCPGTDWRNFGFEDGAAGRDAAAAGGATTACAAAPDMKAYLAGRADGLERFCRPASGFDHGARGFRYAGVCAGPNEAPFIAAYEDGLQLYGLMQNRDAAAHALAAARTEIDSLAARIADADAALAAPTTAHAERVALLVDVKSMRQRRAGLRAEIDDLALDARRAAADLERFRRQRPQSLS